MLWTEVQSVKAWKADWLAFDEIFLLVEDGKAALRLSEETAGFDEFCDQMERSLGLNGSWWGAVAQPAFAPCETRIFARS